jgi:hypothetical protein
MMGQPQFVAQMAVERIVRGQLRGDLFGERTVEPALLIDLGQLLQFEFGVGGEFVPFLCDVGLFGVALRTD